MHDDRIRTERRHVVRPLLLPEPGAAAVVADLVAVDHEHRVALDRAPENRPVPDGEAGLGGQPVHAGVGADALGEGGGLRVADDQHLQEPPVFEGVGGRRPLVGELARPGR